MYELVDEVYCFVFILDIWFVMLDKLVDEVVLFVEGLVCDDLEIILVDKRKVVFLLIYDLEVMFREVIEVLFIRILVVVGED